MNSKTDSLGQNRGIWDKIEFSVSGNTVLEF